MRDLEPPPSKLDLVTSVLDPTKRDIKADSVWKTWLNRLYEFVRDLVAEELQKGAFGGLTVEQPTPEVQLNFNYNINTELVSIHDNNGTSGVENNMLKLSTGAGANQSSAVFSKTAIKYGSGQGLHFRVSGLFTTGVTGSTQLIGAGDSGNGLFFGYQDDVFGIMRLSGGLPEVRTLTITTKSTTAENITITLDGDADATVAVTDATATDATTTANEIAAHDYSNLGRGWDAHADGSTVLFISYDASARAGTYSLGGATTAVGTFAPTLTGVAGTPDFIAQADWNIDTGTGGGNDGLPLMDWTKGNVFQIQFQWLGFGVLNFLIEDPDTGKDTLVHKIQYPNKNTTPSLANPNLQLCASVENTTNTTDIILRSGSMGGFVEGSSTFTSHFHNGVSNTATVAAETPVVSLHNNLIYAGEINKIRAKVIFSSAASDGTKSVVARLTLNPTLTGASFADIETDASILSVDTSATAITGGDEQFTYGLARVDSSGIDMSSMSYYINPGDTLTISAASAGNNDVTASLSVEERF